MKFYSSILFSIIFFLVSCQSEYKGTTQEDVKEDVVSITLTPVLDSPAYSDAQISLVHPQIIDNLAAGDIDFSYAVDNYKLGNQTPDADSKLCANSAKGQHIHNILNNEPYGAYYTSDFKRELEDGHYLSLSFLSRSYHESIKSKDAYVLHQFAVGNEDVISFDMAQPYMFYSRPKGTYLGKDTEKLLLDFYLVNSTLSNGGNSVRATVNGEEFMIDKWVPHFIEGLPMGEVTIKLELLDEEGHLIESPFNPVERTVTLAKDEPLE